MSELKVYPLDLTGSNPSNRIMNEIVTITDEPSRVIFLTGGAFFTKSLKIMQGSRLMRPVLDYVALELNRDATVASGMEVCNVLYIKNPAKSFSITYQVIGGEYSNYTKEAANLLKATPLDKIRTYTWGSITDKPKTFPPTPHTHYPYEWRGYSEVVHELSRIRQSLMTGDQLALANTFKHIEDNITEITVNHITENGLFAIDNTPTPNGNLFLLGNGKADNKLRLDYEAIYREFDSRYFQNIINPLTRVGNTSDLFLTMNSGYNNLISPQSFDDISVFAVSFLEKNGDLITLVPATSGESVGYAYGYVKGWTKHRDIRRLVTTNNIYRHPQLKEEEFIGTMISTNNQSMVVNIYETKDKITTFKEQALIWFNGTMDSNQHTMIRLGDRIKALDLKILSNERPHSLDFKSIWQYHPTFLRLANDDIYFLVHHGSLAISCFSFDEDSLTFTKVENWKGIDRKIVYQLPENGENFPTKVLSTTDEEFANELSMVKPYKWFDTSGGENNSRFLFNTQVMTEDGFTAQNGDWNKRHAVYKVERNTIKAMIGEELFFYIDYKGSHYKGHRKVYYKSLTLDLTDIDEPKFYVPHSTCNSDTVIRRGYLNIIDSLEISPKMETMPTISLLANFNDFFEDNFVMDLSSQNVQVMSDGTVIRYITNGSSGQLNTISASSNGRLGDAYATLDVFKINWARSYKNQHLGLISTNLLNNAAGITIPAKSVVTFPLADETILVRTSYNSAYGAGLGGNANNYTKVYAYRPSKEVIDYAISEGMSLKGYATSDDRIELTNERNDILYMGLPLISARKLLVEPVTENNPVEIYRNMENPAEVKVGALTFHHGTPALNQSLYRDKAPNNISVDWDNALLKSDEIYTLSETVVTKINEYILENVPNPDWIQDAEISQWYLQCSPLRPEEALLSISTLQGFSSDESVRTDAGVAIHYLFVNLTIDDEKVINDIEFTCFIDKELVGNARKHRTPTLSWSILTTNQVAVEYNQDMTESIWLFKRTGGTAHTGDMLSISRLYVVKYNSVINQATVLARINDMDLINMGNTIVATKFGIGFMTDRIGRGLYRGLNIINGWKTPFAYKTRANSDTFIYYNPKPVANFKVNVSAPIDVQIGGVKDSIPIGSYELDDRNHSDIENVRNKKILIYIQLVDGKPKLWFSETSIPESSYNVYIGYLITDENGISEFVVKPVSRIDKFRLSSEPIGSAISVSPNTPDKQTYLNWDTGDVLISQPTTPPPTNNSNTGVVNTRPLTNLPVPTNLPNGITVGPRQQRMDTVIMPDKEWIIRMAGGGGGGGAPITNSNYLPPAPPNHDGADTLMYINGKLAYRCGGGKGAIAEVQTPRASISRVDGIEIDVVIDRLELHHGVVNLANASVYDSAPRPVVQIQVDTEMPFGTGGGSALLKSDSKPNQLLYTGSSGASLKMRMRNMSKNPVVITFVIGFGGDATPDRDLTVNGRSTNGQSGGFFVEEVA